MAETESTIARSSSDGECDTGNSGVRSSYSGPSPFVSLLDRLKCPKMSDLARKWKVHVNPPPKGKRTRRGTRGQGGSTSNPKNASPAQRVKEHPNEKMKVSAHRLSCDTCREELSLKSSSIKTHIKSSKHQCKKKKRQSTEAREQDIAHALVQYNEEVHAKGKTLPAEMQVYRERLLPFCVLGSLYQS